MVDTTAVTITMATAVDTLIADQNEVCLTIIII